MKLEIAKFKNFLSATLFSCMLSIMLTACSGGGGGCDEVLTVEYLQNQFATGFPGFSETNSTIVYSDGNQGNTYDIDTVAVSRTSYDMDDSLAFSYTIYGTTEPPGNTYIAFYLDTDNSVATGPTIGSMGADALVVNAPGGIANGYFLWNAGTLSWDKQPLLGTLGSNAHYFQGCTYSTTIYAPLYNGLSTLYATNVTGIVRVQTISGSDPGIVTSILDTSSEFSFTVP